MQISMKTLQTVIQKLDKQSEDGKFADLVNSCINQNDLKHIATQRALRVIIRERGDEIPNHKKPIALNDDEVSLLKLLSACYVDGFLTGVHSTRKVISESN